MPVDIGLARRDDVRCVIARAEGMRVPGMIYADDRILSGIEGDPVLQQVANVARLPGIVGYSFAMPDIHWGYGFPIGGVAAFAEEDGVISPGGVGYDISCGVRMHVAHVDEAAIRPILPELLHALFAVVPCGVGSGGDVRLGDTKLDSVLGAGARWAVGNGFGTKRDLDRIEFGGCLEGADPSHVSPRARKRGSDQLGTLGAGNHFLEIQVVDRVFDAVSARAFGLEAGRVAVMIHCGSRGLGHQVCDDFIRTFSGAIRKYGIAIPDRQLCCVPVASPEGQAYLAAMRSAANFALANRQVIGSRVRDAFSRFFSGESLDLVCDVSHNTAHIERHDHEGRRRSFCVHRKGATRALPPGHPDLPGCWAATGQPVVIPGSMGTSSYILAAESGAAECFCSTCHGAGRRMSRSAALRETDIPSLIRRMGDRGVLVLADNVRTLGEEAPEAYKDVDRVIDVVERAGLSRKVARLRPLGVIKG